MLRGNCFRGILALASTRVGWHFRSSEQHANDCVRLTGYDFLLVFYVKFSRTVNPNNKKNVAWVLIKRDPAKTSVRNSFESFKGNAVVVFKVLKVVRQLLQTP